MIYTNKKYLSLLKKIQLFAGIVLLIAVTAGIWLERFLLVACLVALLMFFLIFVRILNYNFVRIQLENGRMIIRFYSLYSVERDYESIEFPVASLRHVTVKKYLFGLKWDLHLTVKLKEGLASYPPVCLTAVPSAERDRIVKMIKNLVVSGRK